MMGWSNTARTAAGEGFGAVDDDQDGPGHVQAAVAKADEQVGDQRGVLGGAFHHGQSGCLVPSMPMPNATTQQMVGEVHAVDHERHQIEARAGRAASSSARADSVAATNRRDTADFDVERAWPRRRLPTGSSPAE